MIGHRQGGPKGWGRVSDPTMPLRAAHNLKPPALPGDTYWSFHEHRPALLGNRLKACTAVETMILVGTPHTFDEPLLPEDVL
jgi:hypothetical protein